MRAIGIGPLALDVVRHGGTERQQAGGSCTNILLHLARMGWDCTMCHMAGNDGIAQYLVSDLARNGVKSVSFRHDVPSYVLVINSENGMHTYQRECEHGSKITSCTVVDPGLADRLNPACDVFVFDRAWDVAAKFARKCSGLAWFETYRHAEDDDTWDECVKASDVVKTADDARIPSGKNKIVTRGQEGMSYEWDGKKGRINPFVAPRMVDTCGCGDCVSACCIDAVCKSMPIQYGLERGARLASLNCCYPGPRCMLGSTTQDYRERVMSGEKIADPPDPVNDCGGRFGICRCDAA